MGHVSHILPPAAGARLSALDPCELGRPIHALDSLFQLTQQDLDHGLATAFPGRVGAPVRLGGVSHGRSTPIETPLRWASYHSHLGRSAFAIERSALTALLARRYGSSDWALGARCVPALETATEQRLAAQLGQVLTEALVHRIGGGSAAEGDPSPRLEQNLSSARCPISGPVMFLWAQVLAGAEPLGLVVFALDSDTLAALLRETGLDAVRLEQSQGEQGQALADAHTQAAIDAGVFGAPAYVIDGEIFWGQDRLDFVERRLQA